MLCYPLDLPTILSGENLAYLEPHEEIWKKETGQWYNIQEQAEQFDTFAPFNGRDGFHTGMSYYSGTLFRFPLRSASREKRVSSNVYTVGKLREMLTALRKESRVILLFLRSVTVVKVHEISKEGYCTDVLAISGIMERSQLEQRLRFHQKLKSDFETCSYEIEHPIECTIRFQVKVEDFSQPLNSSESEWLVASLVVSPNQEVRHVAEALKALPWVGVALEISESPSTGGRVFCVLPMPSEVTCNLPVHINATFSLNDERRELKWSGIERKNDASADWNGLIVQHLLPPCYARLLLDHAKDLLTCEAFYRAWPDVNLVRVSAHWEKLIEPLFQLLFQEAVFRSSGNGWVHYSSALFTPRDTVLPSVVTAVLSAYGGSVVTVSDEVWDAFHYMGISVTCIIPQNTRARLKTNQQIYSYYSAHEKLELLRYCLSDDEFGDLSGIALLPLADNTFVFFKKRGLSSPVYLCSSEHPCHLIPGCKDQIVDIADEDLHDKLVSVALCKSTQLERLSANSVAVLLKKCLPGSQISLQWLKLFWEWAAKQGNLNIFSGLPVVPVYAPSSRKTSRVVLSTTTAAVFSAESIDEDLLSVLGKCSVACCEQTRFPFVCTLNASLFNQFSNDGLLDAVYLASHYKSVVLTDSEASTLKSFLLMCSTTKLTRKAVLRGLAIFTALDGKLCSVTQASRHATAQIEPDNFPLSAHYLPPNLVLFSNSEYHQVWLLKSLSVPQPTTATFLVDSVFPQIHNTHCIPLMKETLEQINLIISNASSAEKKRLMSGIENLPFVPVLEGSRELSRPRDLFNPSDPLLREVFLGQAVFPLDPFLSRECLAVLKSCGMKSEASPQEIIGVISQIAVPGEHLRRVDETTYTRAVAVMEYITRWDSDTLLQLVIVNSRKVMLSQALLFLAKHRSLLPVKATPPEEYPSLLWKGNGLSQYLVKYGTSTVVSKNDSLLEMACGSQVYFIEHSLPAAICDLFKPNPATLVKHVIAHLFVVARKPELSPAQKRAITQAIYQVLNMYEYQTKCHRAHLPAECVYISRLDRFVSPGVVALQQNSSFRHNLEPFIYTLPDDLYLFSSLFLSLGVEQCITKQQIVGILARIKARNVVMESEEEWELVMTILNWLTGNGEHAVDVSNCGGRLYVPIEDSSTNRPTLVECQNVVYTDNEFLRRYVGASGTCSAKTYKFVNKRISPQMAQLLCLAPLSQYLEVAEDAFEDAGPSEPLTVRLRNILKDYKDGLTIVKELLQNADDACATEVNICYDARNHSVSPNTLLFPGMAGCHGPALVVHNNAVFTQEDFKNITKLAGATKEGKTLKIGKFGVGFCSVYHMTDIPSFISNEYFYIFDPTLSYLKGDIKNQAEPGKKVAHCINMVVNSQQLAPYQHLFGFTKGQPYQGTLFRFPFRTAPSELSGTVYTPHVVTRMFDDMRNKSSQLLLFLQHIKCIKVHEIRDGQDAPQTQVEVRKEATTSGSTAVVEISCSNSDTRYWLIATHTETVLRQMATASVACSLGVPLPFTAQIVEGEVFCFLPLSVKTGLPVHVSSNFAVTNNRTGLWTSDDESTNIREARWNQSLMKTVIPKAYFLLLECLQQMSQCSKLGEYLFYALWPLGANLTIHNPWTLMVDALYQSLGQSNLFFSECSRKWLPLSNGRLLSPGILSTNPSTTADCALDIAAHLDMPVIDLPPEYHVHLTLTHCMITEEDFLIYFFRQINYILIDLRNKALCLALECYATELDNSSERYNYLSSCLKSNACIPCTPDGQTLRKCSEVIDPNAGFAGLFEEEDRLFPLKAFQKKPLVSKAMECLGIISSHLPIEMLRERAHTVCHIYKVDKSKALERSRMILNCLGSSYMSSYKEDKEMASIEFLPVMPKPKGYPFHWLEDEHELTSGENLMLKGEWIYGQRGNVLLAGSQVLFTNELEPSDGGCGQLYSLSRKILKIRQTPFLSEVVEHFKHVIHIFTSQETPSENTITETNSAMRSIYRFLNGALEKQKVNESHDVPEEEFSKVDLSPLSSLPCVWTGKVFVCCEKVAMKWKTNGPFLYHVPDGYNTCLWEALHIKSEFTAIDLIMALKEISDTCGSGAVSVDILNDVLSELKTDEIPEVTHTIMLPDENLVMQEASSLAFNDAQWLPPDGTTRYVNHKLVNRDLALKLGVRMVRSKLLDTHRAPTKAWPMVGERFGQHEKLTTRIQGILQEYPFDVTILKELLQNADDAKATKMYVILDERTHRGERVLSQAWQKLQGPALLVWNDGEFSEQDIEGIQRLGIGNKRSDAETIGQYGIGFNSVYHLTDCPSFISAGTLCIFDPHYKFTPDATMEHPGEKFRLTEQFWSNFPDIKPAYLRSNLQGRPECREILSGSLFRFPLRHTQELVDASEIVCENMRSESVIFEGVITADKMHEYLKKWAPLVKQSLFFLNNVTELKFFVITEHGWIPMLSLEHHYQVKLDGSAALKRKELHQNLRNFNKVQGSEPFVTKYQLTLTERKSGSEVKEQWVVQQGVGDINNKEQKWNFIEQVKPRHGLAVPLKLGKDQPWKFRGKVFCFLPLPIECHLPVHINGHFILHSSRRALWKITVRDDIDSKQQWNTCLLQAIASSYAQLLMSIKEDYSIESGEVHTEQVKKYYQTFPSWTSPPPPTSPCTSTNSRSSSGTSESVTSRGQKVSSSAMPSMTRAPSMTKSSRHFPSSATYSSPPQSSILQDRNLPTEEWLTLAEDVFRALVNANALVIAVVKEGYRKDVKGKVHTIEWCPLKHDNPTLQVYFSSGIATSGSVFERIGMKLTSTQHWIRKHFEHVGCSVPTADPSAVYAYYANFHKNILSADRSFPCPLKYTSFQTIDNFKKFLEYIILVSKQLQAKSKHSGEGTSNVPHTLAVVESLDSAVLIEVEPSECLPPTEVERIQYPPLIVTADGVLRYCNEESDAVIKSSHSSLFQKCLHYFLHPKLAGLKIPKIFLLDPSSEQNKAVCMERIDHCLASVLPDILAHTSCQALGSGPTLILIDNLWKCFKEELFFQIFLKQILEKWALLLASNGKVYSRFLEEESVLPIIPLENSRKDDDDDADDKEIDFETCTNVSTVLHKLNLPFLNETVSPAIVKGICPTLCEPIFLLQVLYNFHCQSDISNFITGEVASTLLAYFGYIHMKKVTKSLNYLKHLPVFETHQRKFTSLSGKEAYVWPSDMCSEGMEVWLENIGDVVFLNPFGAWSNLELYEQLEVYSISATEIYCKFVFPKFEDMGEDLRYAHLLHIRNSLFEVALTHSKMKRSPKRDSSEQFIRELKTLPCIGSRRPLRAIRDFYDHENVIFSTFLDNFLFLPEYFETNFHRWNKFFKQLDFHFEVTTAEFLRLCQEMANKQHTTNTTSKSRVLFESLFENEDETKNWFSDHYFLSRVIQIPFVVADECKRYTWIAKTPAETHARGTCEVLTDDDKIVHLTKLDEACIYDDVDLVWSVKPVYCVPMNHSQVLPQLKLNYLATVLDVVTHLMVISESGRADPILFHTYTAPTPSHCDVSLLDVVVKCFAFLNSKPECSEIDLLKMAPCIPVPASADERNKMVLVKPSQVLTADSASSFFPYLHRAPYELMASSKLLERIGVKSSIQLSHMQFVLESIHNQLERDVIDPNTNGTISFAMSHMMLMLSTQSSSAGQELSPLYLPGCDGRMHHTSELVYPDTYSYKDCQLPSSADYVLFHYPADSHKDQFNAVNQFCNLLPQAVRPKPLSELCCQQIAVISSCEDIDMARCLKTALSLEQLPTVCLAVFTNSVTLQVERTQEQLSSFFKSVKVVTVENLEVEIAMKDDSSPIGSATVEFHLSSDCEDFHLYLDSRITRMVEEHIHKTLAQELLRAINELIGAGTPGIVVPKVQEAFCLFLKAQTDEELHKACQICSIKVKDAEFVQMLVPQIGHPIPEEWHYMLDQSTDNIFHPQEIVGYETSDGDYVFAQVLYAVPPEENEDDDESSQGQNPLLTMYMIAVQLNDERLVTALQIFKFMRRKRESLAIANVNDEEEVVEEEVSFSDVAEAKRHLCQQLRQIWRMSELDRNRAIRRLYLRWHPDKNLDNVEMATDVFKFLLKQIERLERGLDPEEEEEEEDSEGEVSPSPQWREQYRAWEETARAHRSHGHQHREYFRSRPSGSGVGVGVVGGDWLTQTPDVREGQRWVQQAEFDLVAVDALYEKALTDSKISSHVCFMAHEVAEKALKGGMYAVCGLGSGFLTNHPVVYLAKALRGERPCLASDLPSLTQPLGPYYLNTRFPNRWPRFTVPSDRFFITDAEQARDIARKILDTVQSILRACQTD